MPFAHSGHYPYSAGGTADESDLNNIEDGVAGAYDELESITGSDSGSQPSSDGPFTLATFINNILKQIRNITGKTHWYTAPATSIESLNTAMAGKLSTTGTAADSSKLGGVVAANFPQRGAHNAVSGFTISMGDGDPVTLAANEVYIQRS